MNRTELHVRLPESIARELRALAAESGRTLNAEIVYRLKLTLTGYRH